MKLPFFCSFIYAILMSGCSYHLEDSSHLKDPVSISVPYIEGDSDGKLTSDLIHALAASGYFFCEQTGGQYTLKVKALSDSNERIGFRYDREDPSGKLKKNLIPTEGRRILSVEVSLLEAATGDVVLGPLEVSASEGFDYVDSSSVTDLSFITPSGQRETVINFSLGQLDSIEGAQDDAGVPLYQKLSQTIVDGLLNFLQ